MIGRDQPASIPIARTGKHPARRIPLRTTGITSRVGPVQIVTFPAETVAAPTGMGVLLHYGHLETLFGKMDCGAIPPIPAPITITFLVFINLNPSGLLINFYSPRINPIGVEQRGQIPRSSISRLRFSFRIFLPQAVIIALDDMCHPFKTGDVGTAGILQRRLLIGSGTPGLRGNTTCQFHPVATHFR